MNKDYFSSDKVNELTYEDSQRMLEKVTDVWIYQASEKHLYVMKGAEVIKEVVSETNLDIDAASWKLAYKEYYNRISKDILTKNKYESD